MFALSHPFLLGFSTIFKILLCLLPVHSCNGLHTVCQNMRAVEVPQLGTERRKECSAEETDEGSTQNGKTEEERGTGVQRAVQASGQAARQAASSKRGKAGPRRPTVRVSTWGDAASGLAAGAWLLLRGRVEPRGGGAAGV